jgi:precorrin-2 dehydrogenase / sirohydrochlorin ferrochelatase
MPATATRNCARSWLAKWWTPWLAICRLLTIWRWQEESVTNLFPMFIKLEDRQCLVVGAGRVGEPKIAGLLETGTQVRVIALEATPTVREWADAGKIELELRAFSSADLDGAFLVVVATTSRSLNERVYYEAQRRGVLCNVVDVPDLCDFFYPAVVRRGDLQIAISTAGQSPSLAQKIRQQLEQQFGPGYAAWVAELGATRKLILSSGLDQERKLELLHWLASREAVEAALAKAPVLVANGERK